MQQVVKGGHVLLKIDFKVKALLVDIVNQIRSVEFAPGFLSSSLDKFPLKIRGIRRRLNFIQPGFEPPLNQQSFCIHPPL